MLSKETIIKTAVCGWSVEDDCYVAKSCLFTRAIGTGDTEQEAMNDFLFVLDDAYEDLVKGNVRGYSGPGRPAKGGLNVHMQIRPDAKRFIDSFGSSLGLSQGEVVDYLVSYHSANRSQKPYTLDLGSIIFNGKPSSFSLGKFSLFRSPRTVATFLNSGKWQSVSDSSEQKYTEVTEPPRTTSSSGQIIPFRAPSGPSVASKRASL